MPQQGYLLFVANHQLLHQLKSLIYDTQIYISGLSEKFKLKHIEGSLKPGAFIIAPKPYTGNF